MCLPTIILFLFSSVEEVLLGVNVVPVGIGLSVVVEVEVWFLNSCNVITLWVKAM